MATLRLLGPVHAGKTPVVLVHGFASSPITWANLANELVGDPDIADRYQVWLARYPTGTPVLANRYELAQRIGARVAAVAQRRSGSRERQRRTGIEHVHAIDLPTTGRILSAGAARQMQLGLKFIF